MKKNVLIVPAGTEIGHEIFEALCYSKHWNLIGANTVRDHSEILYDRLLLNFPSVYDPGFAEAVNRAVTRYHVDFVFPAHDEAIVQLAGNLQGAVFAGPSPHIARILRSKTETLLALQDVVPTPCIYAPGNLPDRFPVFAKPDRGQGSRGARQVDSREEYDALCRKHENLVFQELLPGQEVTVDCYTSRNGWLRYAQPRERQRVSMGIASRMSTVCDPNLTAHATAISNTFGLFGPWFFQMKRAVDGTFKLLEVANRIAGSMGFQRALGVNLIDAFLHELSGHEVSFFSNSISGLVYDRALYEQIKWDYRPAVVYVDFDDTLRFEDGSVNYRLIGLLYGFRNNLKAKIVLLSRCADNLDNILLSIGLRNLFHEIIVLDRATPKSAHINESSAIFIDDSFAERAEVFRAHGIPCFGPESCRMLQGCLRSAISSEVIAENWTAC